jgi:hypothetical protein
MRKQTRTRFAVALAASAALAIALAPSAGAGTGPQATAAAGTQCPATFRVLHNDRIGPAVLPKGNYIVTVRSTAVTCASASQLFTQFLSDYDGKLQKPWKVVAQGNGKALFTSGGQPGFSVALSTGPAPAPPGPSPLGTACAGQFQVQNNDRIGGVQFARGAYKLVITRGSIISCAQASKLFSRFLDFPAGDLPKGWAIKPAVAIFYKPGNPKPKRKRFRVDPAGQAS